MDIIDWHRAAPDLFFVQGLIIITEPRPLLRSFTGLVLWETCSRVPAVKAATLATIAVDYPSVGAIFPPEFNPPLFVWSDPSPPPDFGGSGFRLVAARPRF